MRRHLDITVDCGLIVRLALPTIEWGGFVDGAQHHSVLVVDDDPSVRDILTRWSRWYGFQTRESESAEAALDELNRSPADIAVCDVHMGGENGVWLAARIRETLPST